MRSLDRMDDSSYRRLLIERRDHGVVLLTLSNPGKLNATDAVLHAELARVFHDISHDDTIRAVVVTGEGKAFSAGGDLDWIAEQVGNHAQTMKVMREAQLAVDVKPGSYEKQPVSLYSFAMSMTAGPMVPCRSGNSVKLP